MSELNLRRNKDRSKKVRPKNENELIAAIENDQLDSRTRQAKDIREVKRELSERPIATSKALLIDAAAKNAVIMKNLYATAMKADSVLDEKGELIPILGKNLLGFQEAMRKALATLTRFETQKPEGSGDDSLAEILSQVTDEN